MIDKLKELLNVQEIDLRIMSLSQEKEILPLELEKFNEAVNGAEAKIKSLEEEHNSLIKERRQEERDLEEKNETRKKFQEQLYQLKSNKEYTALLHEIENVKNEIDKLEEEVLLYMEKIEDKEKKLAEENKAVQIKRRELEEATEMTEGKLAEIEEKLKELQKDRGEKLSRVPGEIFNQYERIRRARNGIGIVAIRNNACQGCYMELPPQVINETKLGERLITCESCNRILYLDKNP
jgi:predicted  nucleic acid-binding Zn-ribbon protein